MRRVGTGVCVALFLALSCPMAGASTITGVSVVAPSNPQAVPAYAKLELTVAFAGLPANLKPYETAPGSNGMDLKATFTSPAGVSWHVNGFYDGATWRVRFAPGETGAWTFSVSSSDSSGSTGWTGGAFTCVASATRGFAQIKGKYLCYKDGSALFPIGHNTGWQNTVEQPPLADMAAKGENMLSFWLAVPWTKPSDSSNAAKRCAIENMQGGMGSYNQEACAYLDGVFANAEGAGVYLLPSIWSHDQLRDANHPWGTGSWDNNPYSLLCSATDFFKTTDAGADTLQWRYQKNFLRYLIARWGYSQYLLGFVGVVEINGTTGYGGTGSYANKAQAEAWCGSVRTYMAGLDPFRANATGQYPLTFSKTDTPPEMPVIMDAAQWTNGGDLRAMDSYSRQDNNVAVSTAIAMETQAMRSVGPAIHTEFGGDISKGATQPTHLHNGIWSGTAAGAAMMPILWCDGGSFPMLNTPMRTQIQYLSQFMGKIGYLGDVTLAALTIDSGGLLNGWGMGLSDRGFFWLQNPLGLPLASQPVSVSGRAPGAYRVYWYDVWTSGSTPLLTEVVTVDASGTLTLTVPALTVADVACRFAINEAPVASNASIITKSNTPVSVTLSATDANEDALTYSYTLPAYGTLSGTAPNLTYTPNAGFHGTDSFTYKANDNLLDSNTATITIAVNDPPVANDLPSEKTDEDTPLDIIWASAASDPENDPLTFVIVTPPGHGTLTDSGSGLTYQPFLDYNGTDSFTFKANDGHWDSNTATVSITINPVNDPPVAYDQSVVTPQDNSVAITLTATDAENSPLTYAYGQPGHGTVTGTPPNVIYTPAPGYFGPDQFTFTANDGIADGAAATISISVNAAPNITSIWASPATGLVGQGITVSVGASDVNGDTLTYTWNFGDGSPAVVTADPSASHVYASGGSYTVQVNVSDGGGGVTNGSMAVTVSAEVPNSPVGVVQPLVVRALSFKAAGSIGAKATPKDAMKLKGEIVLPDGVNLALGRLFVAFLHPLHGTMNTTVEMGGFTDLDWGGQFFAAISANQKVRRTQMQFSIKPLKKPGAAANAQALTFAGSRSAMAAALQKAVTNLQYHEDGSPLPDNELSQKRSGKVLLVIRFEPVTGNALQYGRTVVVDIRPGKSATIKLTRP